MFPDVISMLTMIHKGNSYIGCIHGPTCGLYGINKSYMGVVIHPDRIKLAKDTNMTLIWSQNSQVES